MTYVIEWGLDPQTDDCYQRRADDPTGLQQILDEIHTAGVPTVVSLYHADDPDGDGLQIGLGHPTHAFALPIERDGDYAVDPAMPPPTDDVVFDHGGEPTAYHPEQLRVSPRRAQEIAHQYASGSR